VIDVTENPHPWAKSGGPARSRCRRWPLRCSIRLALFAGADFAEVLPGIQAEVVIVVPVELNGVFADGFGGNGLGSGFEHGQRARCGFGRLAGLASGFVALFVAHGARTGVAEVDEGVVGGVAVVPVDVDAGAGGQVDLYGLGVCGSGGGLERGLHEFKYRIGD